MMTFKKLARRVGYLPFSSGLLIYFLLQDSSIDDLRKELNERPTEKLVEDLRKKVKILQVSAVIVFKFMRPCFSFSYLFPLVSVLKFFTHLNDPIIWRKCFLLNCLNRHALLMCMCTLL